MGVMASLMLDNQPQIEFIPLLANLTSKPKHPHIKHIPVQILVTKLMYLSVNTSEDERY